MATAKTSFKFYLVKEASSDPNLYTSITFYVDLKIVNVKTLQKFYSFTPFSIGCEICAEI